MEDFHNNIFTNQMNNPQQNQQQMNLQFPQNDIMNQLNQNQGINPSQLYQYTPQQQLNQNNFNNINNMNPNLNLVNNSKSNPNINIINTDFDNLDINPQNQKNQSQNFNMNNININNNIENNLSQQEEEDEISNQDQRINNNDNNNRPASIPETKEESSETFRKKLENKFSFLYRIDDTNTQYSTQKQVMEKEKYESQVKKIAEFDTIDEFWAIFQHLRKPDSCRPGIEYFMFKEPIKPMWEDENNKNGGRFSIKLKHGYSTIIWEEMIFALIGNIFPKEIRDEINGIVITSKKEFNTLQIWFKTFEEKNVKDLEQAIRDLLVIPNEVSLDTKQFSKVEYGNSNKNINSNNNNNNKSGGYYNSRGYGNNRNNNYGEGNHYKDHRKNNKH
jgi:translation initiation factor 4E